MFYFTRKYMGSTEDAYRAVGKTLDIVKVAGATNSDVFLAYQKRARDFGNCIVAMCTGANGCDCIVTYNTKDYTDFGFPAIEPSEFITLFKSK